VNEDRLRRHLADKAAGVDAKPGDPANLKARSANPLLVMGAGLALVALFGAGLAWLLPAGDETNAAAETTVAAETTETTLGVMLEQSSTAATIAVATPGIASDLPPLTAGDGPTLNWQSGQLPEGVWVSGIIPYGDGFLAWGQESQFEADSPPPMQLWRSGDGLEWTSLEATGLDAASEFWVSSMVAAGQRLLAVGIAYDTPPTQSAAHSYYPPTGERNILLTSADGTSWDSTELAVQPSGPTGNAGEYWSSGQPLLATRGDLVVVLTTQALTFDPYIVVADKLGEDARDIGGMSYGPDSIEVLGGVDGNEVIATFTPEELGIDPSYLANGGGGPRETRSAAYISTDGGVTFNAATTSGLDDLGYANGIVTTADGFVISGEQQTTGDQYPTGPAAWRSVDGVGWTKTQPFSSGWLTDLDGYGDLVVGAGENLVVSFDGGATFNRVEGPAFDPVADLEFSVDQVKAGPFGALATGSAWAPGPPPPPLEVEVDGLIYREVYAVSTSNYSVGPTVTITDAASGEVVFSRDDFWKPDHITYDLSGESITFNSPETGEPIVTVDWNEVRPSGPLDNTGTATVERDGLTVTIEFGDVGPGRVVITDTASGEVLFDQDNVFTPSYIQQDTDGYTILDPDTGEPIMRLDYTMLNEAYSTQTVDTGSQEPGVVLWFSADGEAWSRQSMTEAFGVAGWAQAVAVGADRVVVSIQPNDQFAPRTEEEAIAYVPPPTQVWVGTLP
jgi:hypothetical protein